MLREQPGSQAGRWPASQPQRCSYGTRLEANLRSWPPPRFRSQRSSAQPAWPRLNMPPPRRCAACRPSGRAGRAATGLGASAGTAGGSGSTLCPLTSPSCGTQWPGPRAVRSALIAWTSGTSSCISCCPARAFRRRRRRHSAERRGAAGRRAVSDGPRPTGPRPQLLRRTAGCRTSARACSPACSAPIREVFATRAQVHSAPLAQPPPRRSSTATAAAAVAVRRWWFGWSHAQIAATQIDAQALRGAT